MLQEELVESAVKGMLNVLKACNEAKVKRVVVVSSRNSMQGYKSLENKLWLIVDVRDIAETFLLAYEKPEAEGRYICTAHAIRARDLIDKLKICNHLLLKLVVYLIGSLTEGVEDDKVSSDKLLRFLGWSYRPLE
ncbi:hypothetical protein EZV62_021027 [Acer yangbiense]|uniref:NAD(P)-binding domain-containing protein n=1 Tax=Acer yangbiense TaxID=1000413 RepID=A0A5C7H4D6_9ROSI|nr:hypothetical protein EZV62_021027 [Acer yangbiense]